MDVADLLKRMADAYASLRTYCDSGLVSRSFITTRTSAVSQATFCTYFARPDQFRFNYTVRPSPDPWPRHSFVIWTGGGETKMFTRGKITATNLKRALWEVAFREHPDSIAVPSLLLPDELRLKRFLYGVDDFVHHGLEFIEGRRCHRIVGHRGDSFPSEISLSLDVDGWLVRRILERTFFGLSRREREAADRDKRLRAAGIPTQLLPSYAKTKKHDHFESESVTSYSPRKNPAIDPAVFRIVRPQSPE